MSIEAQNPVNTDAVFESAVNKEADKAIAFTCNKHGVTRDQLNPEVIDRAYYDARVKVKHESELAQDKNYQELLSERAKVHQLQLELEILRTQPYYSGDSVGLQTGTRSLSSSKTPGELAMEGMGIGKWNSLTENQRLAAAGVIPTEVTASVRQEIAELFGRNPNSKRASDLAKENPRRYKFLRNVCRTLDLQSR